MAAQQAPLAQPTPASTPAPASEPESPWLGPGWQKLSQRDSLPICMFSSAEERGQAIHVHQAKKTELKADAKLVFGVFPPWCLNEACDARPNLQCWLDQKGNTIELHSLFFAFHKDGSDCTTDCIEPDSSCETEALKPGKYKIVHGDKTWKLTIPSSPDDPCLR